jgi:hypothetical protein
VQPVLTTWRWTLRELWYYFLFVIFCIYSLNKYSVNLYYMPDTALGSGMVTQWWTKQVFLPSVTLHSEHLKRA